jgi:cytochrome c oxidase subunit 4
MAAEHAHTPTIKPYILVFAALVVATVLTYAVALVDFGWANDIIALTIAVTKMLLVILFFMHVRHSTRLTKLTAFAGFLWLAIMILVTMSDYVTRGSALLPVLGK